MRRFVELLIRWRWPLLLVGVAVGALSYLPAGQLEFDRSIENMFAPDDPILTPYRRLRRTFGGNEIVLAAYVDPDLLASAGLARLKQLTVRLQRTPGVEAVLSLNNGPLGDQIASQNELGRRFIDLFTGYTIGADRQTTAVVCMLDPRSSVPRAETVLELRRLIEDHDFSGVVVGEPVMVVDGFRYLEQDGARLGFVSTILLVLTIVLCFRSLRWVLLPLAVVQLTLLMTQAWMAFGNVHLTMVSSMLNAIVTIVGIATTVHLIVRYREMRAIGASPRAALEDAGVRLTGPIVGACATDAVGFGALMFARVGAVHDFGLMMLVSSLLVLVSLVLLTPGMALIGRFDADPKRAWGESTLDSGLLGLSTWVERRPKTLWAVSITAAALAALGCTRLEVETDFTKNFRAGSPLVRSYEFVETNLGGAGVWDVMLPAPKILDWPYLRSVLKLEERLRREVAVRDAAGIRQPGLTKVLSIADTLDALGLGQLEKLPAGRLRDMALSAGLSQMRSQMPVFMGALLGEDPERPGQRYLRIMLRSRERQPAEQKQQLIAEVSDICRQEFPRSEVTGFFVMLTNLVGSMSRDQWLTFGLAALGIALMLWAAYRSLSIALIALVPNALPIFVVTGLMGWLGLKINMGAAMIAAVSMGLSVDSSIHYLTAFFRLRREGLSLHQSLAAVHQSVGRAMVFSTLALVAGFSALCLSQFVPTIYFGAMVGLTMLGGLAGNLIVLPLLLTLYRPRVRKAAEN